MPLEDNITEKIARITRCSEGVKMLKDAVGNSRPSCRIDAHLLRGTRTHLMAGEDFVGPGWLQLVSAITRSSPELPSGFTDDFLDDGGLPRRHLSHAKTTNFPNNKFPPGERTSSKGC